MHSRRTTKTTRLPRDQRCWTNPRTTLTRVAARANSGSRANNSRPAWRSSRATDAVSGAGWNTRSSRSRHSSPQLLWMVCGKRQDLLRHTSLSTNYVGELRSPRSTPCTCPISSLLAGSAGLKESWEALMFSRRGRVHAEEAACCRGRVRLACFAHNVLADESRDR